MPTAPTIEKQELHRGGGASMSCKKIHIMKNISIFIFPLFFFFSLSAQNTLTFQLDLAAEESVDEVGLRGNLPPLSWEESVPMTDPDGDGVYTASIEFPSVEAGNTIAKKMAKTGNCK